MEPSSKSIDRAIYTALLATSLQDLDQILLPLRTTTADLKPGQALTPVQESTIASVQNQIETYLVTKEKLRYFTRESLQVQIEQHLAGFTGRKSRRQLLVVIGLSSLIAIVTASLPILHSAQQRGRVGGGVLFSMLTIGAATLFLSALPAFTSQLRRAFRVICTGVTVLGLSLLQQPLLHILNIQSEPLVSILYPLPILVASILFHIGNVKYARLLGVRNRWTTARPILISGLVLSLVAWFLPHPAVMESELLHDLATVLWSWVLIMPIASAIVLRKAIPLQPELYKPSVRALFQAMIPIIAVTSYLFCLNMAANPYSDTPFVYALFVLVIIMSIALVRSGYVFNKVSRY